MIQKSLLLVALTAAMSAGIATAFAPSTLVNLRRPAPLLRMSASDEDKPDTGKIVGASAVAAAYILSNILAGDVAFAMEYPNDTASFAGPTSTLVAARSGGRAGGRSSMGGMGRGMRSGGGARMSPGMSRSYGGGRGFGSNTYIMPSRPSIMVSPFGGMGYGYGYNPFGGFGGFGLGYGLGGMNSGNAARENRQETELAREKGELEAAKERQVELERRIAELEKAGRSDIAQKGSEMKVELDKKIAQLEKAEDSPVGAAAVSK